LYGPFAGLQYPFDSISTRHSVPMLVGSYERELHEVIAACLKREYDQVIDIGSAEGYYAVGFALKGRAPVVAYETDGRELSRCKEMARINHVEDRLTFRSWCSPGKLKDAAVGRCLIISDCEGFEKELFTEDVARSLLSCDVLIELHDDAFEILMERFSKTHSVRIVSASPRTADDYQELSCLGEDASRAVWEYRAPDQRWLYAENLVTSRP
jgi:ribosomal protein L11 methylase PrmA